MLIKRPWAEVEVDGYYEPAEKGSYQDGMQMEPDISSCYIVESIKLGEAELIDVLQQAEITEIEELALQAFEEGVRDAKEQASIDYEDR